MYGVEVKSGATVAKDFFPPLSAFADRIATHLTHLRARPRLVYGGDRREVRRGVEVVPWREVQGLK